MNCVTELLGALARLCQAYTSPQGARNTPRNTTQQQRMRSAAGAPGGRVARRAQERQKRGVVGKHGLRHRARVLSKAVHEERHERVHLDARLEVAAGVQQRLERAHMVCILEGRDDDLQGCQQSSNCGQRGCAQPGLGRAQACACVRLR